MRMQSCTNNIHGIKTTIRHNAKGGARNISRTSEPNFLPSILTLMAMDGSGTYKS
jgi:hypothetical protein